MFSNVFSNGRVLMVFVIIVSLSRIFLLFFRDWIVLFNCFGIFYFVF